MRHGDFDFADGPNVICRFAAPAKFKTWHLPETRYLGMQGEQRVSERLRFRKCALSGLEIT
jgi:hypothetical protein